MKGFGCRPDRKRMAGTELTEPAAQSQTSRVWWTCGDVSRSPIRQYVILRRDSERPRRSGSDLSSLHWRKGRREGHRRRRMARTHIVDDFEAIRRRLQELRGDMSSDAGNHPLRRWISPSSGREPSSLSPPMSLRTACKLAGYAGRRCAVCCLATRCFDDSRWLVTGHGRLA